MEDWGHCGNQAAAEAGQTVLDGEILPMKVVVGPLQRIASP